jgi:hypothetical protein
VRIVSYLPLQTPEEWGFGGGCISIVAKGRDSEIYIPVGRRLYRKWLFWCILQDGMAACDIQYRLGGRGEFLF